MRGQRGGGDTALEPPATKTQVSQKAEVIAPLPPMNSPFQDVSRQISDRDFQQFQQLVYREAGIWLSSGKIALLTGRLAKRLRHHGIRSFKDYYALVLESPEERVQMLDAITTNETHFFREAQHFELLNSEIFPQWVR